MFSKLLQPCRSQAPRLLVVKSGQPARQPARGSSFLPPSQYDMAIPNRLRLGYALTKYWELIPVVGVTLFALSVVCAAIIWAAKNKVDVVFTTNSRNNLSRTMDLRQPTSHKLLLINQRYEPWPEMADVLEKMAAAEERAEVHLKACARAQPI